MIIGLFRDAVGWLVGLTEATVVIAAILFIGLVVGTAGFWILGHFLRNLAGPPPELDPYEDEPEEMAGAEVSSIYPDEDSPSSKLGA
jgi:hypothetical protein